MANKPRIAVIEPYFGGSHHAFLQGLMKNVDADYTVFTLPARSWKSRMQLSAPWFVQQIAALPIKKRWFDTVLCSTFVDVAVLRAVLQTVDGVNPTSRYCLYFHENQFVYPGRHSASSMRQFQAINFNSALAADRLAFNSLYNQKTFFEHCAKYLNTSSDMTLAGVLPDIASKSVVLYPGIDFSIIDTVSRKKRSQHPVIIWNHRWEHDKNPEEFFQALFDLKERKIDFQLIVLGQSFADQPDCFARARKVLDDRVLHYGYVDSIADYGSLLRQGDVVVSTAFHEFFGIAILEAVRAGCRPLLPMRLAYPEIFPSEYLYSDGELNARLETLLSSTDAIKNQSYVSLTEPYSWPNVSGRYAEWLYS